MNWRASLLTLALLLTVTFSVTSSVGADCIVKLTGEAGGTTSSMSYSLGAFSGGFSQTFRSGNRNFFENFENLKNIWKGDMDAVFFLYSLTSPKELAAMMAFEGITGVNLDDYIPSEEMAYNLLSRV
ncbi:MAG: hypothetical protein HN521_05305 [Candidatus Latescibacteria bacterium]|jgi:hypothetical protein|nr:hypothetical protein [Candidatus Latescibacterota bacterium]